jgi:hypothetical protein
MSVPRTLLFATLLSLVVPATAAVDVVATGAVFADGNGNGLRDPGEMGMAGIKLSNGRDIVLTRADGGYSLPVRPGDTVFAIKPAGHAFARRDDGLPAFWQHYFPEGSPALAYAGIPRQAGLRMDVALQETHPAPGGLAAWRSWCWPIRR